MTSNGEHDFGGAGDFDDLARRSGGGRPGNIEVDRWDTLLRILLTLVFAVVHGLLDSAIGVIVIFSILWALLTGRSPNERLRSLANRIVTFDYRIRRYTTYNEAQLPFPFSDFPAALEDSSWSPDFREACALGLSSQDGTTPPKGDHVS